jgi:hypothetical protein
MTPTPSPPTGRPSVRRRGGYGESREPATGSRIREAATGSRIREAATGSRIRYGALDLRSWTVETVRGARYG